MMLVPELHFDVMPQVFDRVEVWRMWWPVLQAPNAVLGVPFFHYLGPVAWDTIILVLELISIP
jgi:hypothetical protein